MQTFADRVQLLRAESQRIAQYLRTLPAEAWTRQSICPQWQVADIVAHLVGVAEFYAGNITRGLQGNAAPPAGRPPAGVLTGAAAAEGIAQRSIEARKSLGDRLLSTFESTGEHLCQVIAALKPDERQTPCYHPGGIVTAQNFIGLRIKELALHEWDIRASLEPTPHLSSASLPIILDVISESIASGSLRWAFWSGPKLPAPVRYRFEVTGTGPRQSDLVVEGDAVRMEDTGNSQADVTFRCETETYVLLIYGRLNLDNALASGRLVAEGDGKLAKDFGQWFRGI
jgi:uncharacterized protein (TIGR03083 family)